MHTRRNYKSKARRTRRMCKRGGASKGKGKSGKQWTTAIEAAQNTLKKTGSINAAKESLRKQALSNARKLFGSI